MEERPSYYAVIPASVRYDKKCVPAARLLYGEIAALTSKEGYCWASNEYFAGLYDVDPSTASAWVAQLVEAGHVRTEVELAEGNRRKIWLQGEEVSGKSRRGLRKKPERSPEKAGEGSPEKAGGINTSSITTPMTDRFVTDVFWAEYQEATGQKPVYKAQFTDWRKRIWKSAGGKEALVRAVVRSFFAEQWFFTKGRRFDFSILYQHWNEVLAHVSSSWKARAPAREEPLSLLDLARRGNGNGKGGTEASGGGGGEGAEVVAR